MCNNSSNVNNLNLHIFCFNARSLLSKVDELRLICVTNTPHVICVVETWLRDKIPDTRLDKPLLV